jgi:phosphoenolpyruvate carboxykinase (GTP)
MCFLRVGEDGRLWALNPTSCIDTALVGGNGNAGSDLGIRRDAIFSDTALQRDGTPWWEACGRPARASMMSWRGLPWTPAAQEPAAHRGARFTVAAKRCPRVSPSFHDPEGVPISAILFGGRRSTLTPLVFEATSWEHGIYVGATTRSEATRGASGEQEVLRNDPMAMLPFCAYNMADYFRYWLRLGWQLRVKPRIFHVNWFRTDRRGDLLWPGFGENVRVLQWVVRRVERALEARRTPIGWLPQSLDMTGLALDGDTLERLLRVDVGAWLEEVVANQSFLARFGERLPGTLQREHEALVRRLRDATN